jgi:hypothetical protein
MSAMSDLLAYQRQTEALSQVMGRLGWDQETVMPPGAATQRGEEMAALEAVLHARRSDPFVGEMIARAEPGDGGRGRAAAPDRAGACPDGQDPRRSGHGTGAGDLRGAGHLGAGAGR